MELSKLKVSVIGCGWLGLPLCESLMQKGAIVTTTTTSGEKQQTIENILPKLDIHSFDIASQKAEQKLLNADVLIYTIPPLGKKEYQAFFQDITRTQKIIFISSTSVYGKNAGEVDELSVKIPESKNGKILLETEEYLRKHFQNLTIIRPGGLYGNLRHPIYSLQGKKNLTNAQEWLHLVHLEDCIQAIGKIIEKDIWNEDINLVNDLRHKKVDYYTAIAKKLGKIPPQYLENVIDHPTLISNKKSKSLLSLKYNNL